MCKRKEQKGGGESQQQPTMHPRANAELQWSPCEGKSQGGKKMKMPTFGSFIPNVYARALSVEMKAK